MEVAEERTENILHENVYGANEMESNNDSDSVDVMDSENQGDTEEALDKEEERHVDEGKQTSLSLEMGDPEGTDATGGGLKGKKQQRLIQFPLARVKSIIKSDPDIAIVSQDTVFLVTKATELFVKYLSHECLQQTQEAKRKVIQRKDLDYPLRRNDCLMFLEGCMDQ